MGGKPKEFKLEDMKPIQLKTTEGIIDFDPETSLGNTQLIIEAVVESIKDNEIEEAIEILETHLELVALKIIKTS